MIKALPFLTLLLAAPLPAAAQGQFSLPGGCEGYVTIQKRLCMVTHLFRCEGDPAGHQRRADLGAMGLSFLATIDAETQWIESFTVADGSTDRLLPGAPDPASFSSLIATGADGLHFSTESDLYGVTVHVGQDRLTGERVTIDGVTLEVTEFSLTAYEPSGTELWRSEGREYINRDWRSFVSGTRTVTTPSESWSDDNSPVDFAFPGEAGFLAASPRFGCDEMMSKAPAP